MKKFTRELKQINNFLENAKDILENHCHNDRYNQYIAVNVKRYNDYVNVENLIDDMKISEKKKDFLKSEFSENYINDIYFYWLENEANYFTDDVMGGCRNCNAQYWDKEIHLVKSNEKINYPHIDNIGKKADKIKELEKWKAKDIKELKYLSILDNKLSGFFGRSGGWLGIKEANILQNRIDEIENNLDYFKDSDNKEDREGYIEDCLYYVDNGLIEALYWIIEEINIFNKGLNFKDEIKYRIDNMLEILKLKEVY